jgi:hypothetical protein
LTVADENVGAGEKAVAGRDDVVQPKTARHRRRPRPVLRDHLRRGTPKSGLSII